MTCRALVLAVGLALAWAPAASAGTASVVGNTLTYAAGEGETNTVNIAYDNSVSGYAITDSTAPVLGGPGCGAIEHVVDCEDTGISAIVINLRDGNDTWTGGNIKIVPSVDGGDGDDKLSGIGFLS